MINRTQEEIMQNWPKEWNIPLVSIRCATFNHENYISNALDGFLKQETNFPFEIIVHDDASTDRTASIIKEYEQKFPNIIKPIYETENQYSKHNGSIRDIITAACKGKYFAFCEGDDYWTAPCKLQMQINWLESHPDYAMCFHGSKIIKELETPCGLKCDSIENRDYSPTELFQEWIVPTASICIKKEALSYPIKHPENILNGDIILIEKAAHSGKVRGLENIMAVYRVHSNGVTYNINHKNERLKKLSKHYKVIKDSFPLIEKKVVNKMLFNSYIWRWNSDNYHIKWQLKAFFAFPTYFFKNQFATIFAAFRLLKQKKYKDALISLPFLNILILYLYYNVLSYKKY